MRLLLHEDVFVMQKKKTKTCLRINIILTRDSLEMQYPKFENSRLGLIKSVHYAVSLTPPSTGLSAKLFSQIKVSYPTVPKEQKRISRFFIASRQNLRPLLKTD